MRVAFYFTGMCNHVITKACPSLKGMKPTQNEQATKLADFSAQGKAKPDNYLGQARIQ